MPLSPEWKQLIVEEKARLAAGRAQYEDKIQEIDRSVMSLEVDIRTTRDELAEARARVHALEDVLHEKGVRQSDLVHSLKGCKEVIERSRAAERELDIRLLPIHDFPVEILALIFVELVKTDDNMKWVLAGVCRLWRKLTLTTPQLWCRCSVELTSLTLSALGSLRLQLERTREYPLDMTLHFRRQPTGYDVDDSDSDEWSPKYDISECINDFLPSMDRWKYLTMRLDRGPNTSDGFTFLLNSMAVHTLQKLETFSLTSRTTREWLMSNAQMQGIAGIHGVAPHLSILSIRNIRIPVDRLPPIASDSLRSLQMEDVTISLSAWKDMLLALPELEDLGFTFTRQRVRLFHDLLRDDDLSSISIILYKLRKFKCHAHATLAPYVKQLLSLLHCPSLEEFSLGSCNNEIYLDHIKMRADNILFFHRARLLKRVEFDHIFWESEAVGLFLDAVPKLTYFSSYGWPPDLFHEFLYASNSTTVLPSLRHVEFHGECAPIDLLPWMEARASCEFELTSCLERLLWSPDQQAKLQLLAGEGRCTWSDHTSPDEMLSLEEFWLEA